MHCKWVSECNVCRNPSRIINCLPPFRAFNRVSHPQNRQEGGKFPIVKWKSVIIYAHTQASISGGVFTQVVWPPFCLWAPTCPFRGEEARGHPLCGLMARYVLSMARVIRGQPLVLAETMGCVEALGFRRTIQTLADWLCQDLMEGGQRWWYLLTK